MDLAVLQAQNNAALGSSNIRTPGLIIGPGGFPPDSILKLEGVKLGPAPSPFNDQYRQVIYVSAPDPLHSTLQQVSQVFSTVVSIAAPVVGLGLALANKFIGQNQSNPFVINASAPPKNTISSLNRILGDQTIKEIGIGIGALGVLGIIIRILK